MSSCFGLLSVVAETSEPLLSKWTSASVAIPAFRRCLRNRCLANDHIPQNVSERHVNFSETDFGYVTWIFRMRIRLTPRSSKRVTGYGL
jgi:hypothetical protein